MELVFLSLLILLMVLALTSGYPVAFALPGSAIITIALAAACGYLFAGDSTAYFAQDGATQWLSAGVTNFRSLYWDVERDTLIAIPLFIFMGIMLQRSKIAEDLLVAMARLFGPIPGGLGISVVFVGALLAATTGIVGATVIAMGLISLPAMLRNNYSKPLATGTICASGTLGQIIPPSIVLIILADQLSSAADQASTLRKAAYKAATGEFQMPSSLDVTSASAGDMFMGAFIPGMILVGLYMAYILITAILRPGSAPPVPFEGTYDRQFAKQVLLALVPPLALIFTVLGSIIFGIATVNQAGAIGAVGALIMAGYRLTDGQKRSYWPAIMAIGSVITILVLLSQNTINIKNIKGPEDLLNIQIAAAAVAVLVIAVAWSTWRAWRIEDTLREVVTETAKTTSMVFIILIGAAMLTSAFRAFGGEELVRHYLTSLPGGFWTQFLVVMLVMFLLGFFLDFIEIAVVVVPIVAPILLADPQANITAVWLGVMIGLNIQTSFLTPPFGFALFYLRGVAPPEVKTTHIYKGAVAFICLQLGGLAIAGYFPPLVNYLPYSTYLTSENAPPPINPRIQQCMRESVFADYAANRTTLDNAIAAAQGLDLSSLQDDDAKKLQSSTDKAANTFALVEGIQQAKTALDDYGETYRPLLYQVRDIEKAIRRQQQTIEGLEQQRTLESRSDVPDADTLASLDQKIAGLTANITAREASIPAQWSAANAQFNALTAAHEKAIRDYTRNVDDAYTELAEVRDVVSSADDLAALAPLFDDLSHIAETQAGKPSQTAIKAIESQFSAVAGTRQIKSHIAKARRAIKKEASADRNKAREQLRLAREVFDTSVAQRRQAKASIGPAIEQYHDAIAGSIGLRQQKSLPTSVAKDIARCQSEHRDISLHF